MVTGARGFAGSWLARRLLHEGSEVVSYDRGSSTRRSGLELHGIEAEVADVTGDLRDAELVERTLTDNRVEVVFHLAAQAIVGEANASPVPTFEANIQGTWTLLEACRAAGVEAVVVASSDKAYGPHEELPYAEGAALQPVYPYDVSKAAADLLVQEYGRYFEMPTVCFRGGCLTGPQHAGAKLHGFLAYLMKCTVTGTPYTVFGYEGKQVRDNIHSADLIAAFDAFRKAPRPHAVYNIGGGRFSNCSMLEAIEVCERVAGRELEWEMGEEPRIGDHRWWISDLAPFEADYPEFGLRYGIEEILQEMYEQNVERWTATPA